MGILATAVVALAALACFLKPTWGFLGYVALLLIRPNELVEGVLVPAMPVMILAIGGGYILNVGRTLPYPAGAPKPKTIPLMIGMMVMLLLHLLVFRRHLLVDWILVEFASVIMLLLYAARHMSTIDRVRGYFSTIMASASTVAGVSFLVHFLTKGKKMMVKNKTGDLVESYGKLWDSFHLHGSWRLMGKANGMWGNSNDLGMLVNLAVPGVIYYLRRKGGKIWKLPALALLGMLGAVLMLTGSRGGQLQLGVTFWMIFVGGKRKALGVIMLLVAMVGILFVLPKLAPERKDSAASADERKLLLEAGVQMFKRNPIIGLGFQSFPENSFRSLMAHNVYMQCLAETGLVGAAVFFPLVFLLRRDTSRAVKYFEAKGDWNQGLLARCIGAVQFSFTVFMFFSNQFMRFTFALPMTAAIALQIAAHRHRIETEAKASAEAAKTEADLVGEAVAAPRPALPPARRPALPARAPLALPAHDVQGEGAPAVGARYVFDPTAPEAGVQQVEGEGEGEGEEEEEPPRRPPPRQRPPWRRG